MLHPTAIIHPKARLDPTVTVGPYAIIEEGVEIGPGCDIGPYVHITGLTRIGANNRFFGGAGIGEAPQDLKYKGGPTRLRIGDHNTFREHCTVNRANSPETETVVGSHNLLMAGCHVGHDVVLGDRIILANGALLAGHVLVGDRALISGNCCVHQFVRVGALAIMRGGCAISKDLPPFTMVHDENILCGLNIIGLRRAGFTPAERLELKQLYRLLFRQGLNLSVAQDSARKQFSSPRAKELLDFLATSKRGVCAEAGRRRQAEEEDQGSEG